MSKEDFLARIRNMDPEEHMKTTEKAIAKNPSFVRKIDRKKKIRTILNIAKTLGIGETFTSSSSGKSSSRDNNDSPGFRHSHGSAHPGNNSPKPSPFSVEGFNPIEAENLRIYLDGIDGKGDHNCDHEH